MIRKWIQDYEIPFMSPPIQLSCPIERTWSDEDKLLIDKQINKLIDKGAIERCFPFQGQFLSNIFLIPKPDGTQRLILNLKKLNEFVTAEHFKIKDWKVAKRLIGPQAYMATLDLKEAYYLIPIKKKDRKFLRFLYRGELFEFTCLSFGLNVAPYMFTKILKPVAAYLRKRGLTSVFYLDDILLIGRSYEKCIDNIQKTATLLQELGFIINEKESMTIPTQRCKYLGLVFDSKKMSIELTEEKIHRTIDLLNKFSKRSHCTIREFAAFMGTLVSRCSALQYGMIYVRRFEKERLRALKVNHKNFDAKMIISAELEEDFAWWKRNILVASAPMTEPVYNLEIFSDASLTGWGVFCGDQGSHGFWKAKDLELHINVLELMAAFFGLKCFANNRRRCNIMLRLDNTTAIAYINGMRDSRYEGLSSIAREIWQWCEEREIWITASYIPSEKNVEADYESRRLQSETEFELNNSAYQKIIKAFGQPEIDLFASRANAKCRRYVSWRKDPGSMAIDAFTLK